MQNPIAPVAAQQQPVLPAPAIRQPDAAAAPIPQHQPNEGDDMQVDRGADRALEPQRGVKRAADGALLAARDDRDHGAVTADQVKTIVKDTLTEIQGPAGARAIDSIREDVQSLWLNKQASDYFPGKEFKKPKLQHQYDAIRDIGRSLYLAENAPTPEDTRIALRDAKKLVVARAAALVTAGTLGWEVARHVEPDQTDFMQDAKPLIKEARAKAKKGDIRSDSVSFRRPPHNNRFFLGESSAATRTNFTPYRNNTGTTTRVGTPSKQRGRPKCWTCGGDHLKRDCPHNKKG
jgi:hypothetical protein